MKTISGAFTSVISRMKARRHQHQEMQLENHFHMSSELETFSETRAVFIVLYNSLLLTLLF
jgi:hypothetical protein